MAGLLDVFNSDEGRFGMSLLAAAAPRVGGGGFGQRLQEAIGSMDAYKKQQIMAQIQKMQMQNAQAEMADKQAQRAQGQTNQAGVMGMVKQGGGFDPRAFMEANPGVDLAGLQQAMQMNSAMNPAPKYETLAPGASLYKMGPNGPELSMHAPKEASIPSAIQEYQFAKGEGFKGNFEQWDTARKRAGASSVSLKVDNKMGESLAGQVGPMAKDSRIQTQGAVKMFDAADRLEKALDSNKVTSGPLATQIQTAKQLIQVIGGGNDDGIRQTRQAIKSLAQMAVEARKQLQGQGQVTESEAAAVAKADAGELNDLTTGELRDLVTLTKRASHYQAKAHSELMGTLGGKKETQGLVPFYGVQGLDSLLKHSPELPKIGGGGWSIKPVGQ